MTPEEQAAAVAEIDRIVSASTRLAGMIGVNYKLDHEKLKSFPGGQTYLDRLTSPPSASAKRGVELTCDDCRQPYTVWFAPNDVWNRVMGGPDCKDDPGGMLCPRCFTLRAEAAGIVPTGWEVRPETPPDASVREEAERVVWDGLRLDTLENLLPDDYDLDRLEPLQEAIASALERREREIERLNADFDEEIQDHEKEANRADANRIRAEAAEAMLARAMEALKLLANVEMRNRDLSALIRTIEDAALQTHGDEPRQS